MAGGFDPVPFQPDAFQKEVAATEAGFQCDAFQVSAFQNVCGAAPVRAQVIPSGGRMPWRRLPLPRPIKLPPWLQEPEEEEQLPDPIPAVEVTIVTQDADISHLEPDAVVRRRKRKKREEELLLLRSRRDLH